jgi:hypothetical protein
MFAILGRSFWLLVFLMVLFGWPALVGVVRAEFLRARNFEYVRAAKALGVSNWTIMFRHMLPNAMVATLTMLPFIITGTIGTLASLDFLGFGLPSSAPSLGELTLQAKQNLQAPWLGFTAFFTFAIMLSLLVFIFEGVRDAFDPRKTFHERTRFWRSRTSRDASAGRASGRTGRPPAVKGVSFTSEQGRDRGAGGRKRARANRSRRCRPCRCWATARRSRVGPLRRAGDGRRARGDLRAGARQRHQLHLPGADDLAQPAAHAGKAAGRSLAAPGPDRRGGARADPRTADKVGIRDPESRLAPIRTSCRAGSASG